MDAELKAKAEEIRVELHQMGEAFQHGDDSVLLHWVIEGELACAHRPLRHHPNFGGSGKTLPPNARKNLFEWTARVFDAGIRSIICLMHPKEIRLYADLDLGSANLIEFYRDQGFYVEHIPWDDPAHRPSLDRATFQDELRCVREEALIAFAKLPKPVLIHCSAGIDRSAPVAAYIFYKRHNAGNR